jgi:hypothetical protein
MGLGGERDTLHDYSVDYVKVLAEVFGWRVTVSRGRIRGPDAVIEHVVHTDEGEIVDAVMIVESEVGHDQGGASRYFEGLARRIGPLIREYRSRYGDDLHISIVVITNAPRRLADYLKDTESRRRLGETMGLRLVEGWSIFVVPALIAREVLPSVFVRAMGSRARCA